MPPRRGFRTDPHTDWFPVRITGEPAAGEYTFVEVQLVAAGTYDDKAGGRQATADSPGVAIIGTFAADDYALARHAPGAAGNFFELLPITATAGASLQVEDVDESPSVSSVTQLRFDSADGLVVSSPGAGIARVDLALGNGQVQSGFAHSVSADNTWEDTGFDLTLSAAGTYLVLLRYVGQAEKSGGLTGAVLTRLWNETTGAEVAHSVMLAAHVDADNVQEQQHVTQHQIITVAGATTLRLEAWRNSGTTWAVAAVYGNGLFGAGQHEAVFSAIKLSS